MLTSSFLQKIYRPRLVCQGRLLLLHFPTALQGTSATFFDKTRTFVRIKTGNFPLNRTPVRLFFTKKRHFSPPPKNITPYLPHSFSFSLAPFFSLFPLSFSFHRTLPYSLVLFPPYPPILSRSLSIVPSHTLSSTRPPVLSSTHTQLSSLPFTPFLSFEHLFKYSNVFCLSTPTCIISLLYLYAHPFRPPRLRALFPPPFFPPFPLSSPCLSSFILYSPLLPPHSSFFSLLFEHLFKYSNVIAPYTRIITPRLHSPRTSAHHTPTSQVPPTLPF